MEFFYIQSKCHQQHIDITEYIYFYCSSCINKMQYLKINCITTNNDIDQFMMYLIDSGSEASENTR